MQWKGQVGMRGLTSSTLRRSLSNRCAETAGLNAQCLIEGRFFMHTYEFTFKCKHCAKELREVVTSPEVLTREELSQMDFQLTCSNADCAWSGTQTGGEAEKIKAALKPMSARG
jgi:hypothetical protein